MVLVRVLLLVSLALIASSQLLAQPEGGGYVFDGIVAFKGHKKELCPVLGTTKSGLLIRTSSGEKRAKFGQDKVSFQKTIVATEAYAEIGNYKFNFDNRAQFRREGALQSALDADIGFVQSKMDEIDTTSDPVVSGQPSTMSKEEFRASLSQTRESSRDLAESGFEGISPLADTVYISFDIQVEADFESTYAAVILMHDQLDELGNVVSRVGIPSLEKTGDLMADIPNRVSIELSTREQLLSNLELMIFLFTKEGEPIATNASGAVRRVSAEDLNALNAEKTLR